MCPVRLEELAGWGLFLVQRIRALPASRLHHLERLGAGFPLIVGKLRHVLLILLVAALKRLPLSTELIEHEAATQRSFAHAHPLTPPQRSIMFGKGELAVGQTLAGSDRIPPVMLDGSFAVLPSLLCPSLPMLSFIFS